MSGLLGQGNTPELHELSRSELERLVQELADAEAAISHSDARRREAFQLAQLGFWDLDLGTGALFWCDMIYRIFEIDPNEFGASYEAFLDTVHPDDRAFVDRSFRESVERKTAYNIIHRLLMPDGRIKWVNERCRTEYAADGKPVRSLGTVTDITTVRQLEDQLRHAQKMELIGQLTGGIAHDFNNLLTVILGGTETVLSDTAESDPSQGTLKMVYEAAERCSDLTRQLLAFSRRQMLDMRALDINEVLRTALPIIRQSITDRIVLETVRAPAPVIVNADLGQLTQVLLNLCLNARDAMPDGGRLTISINVGSWPPPSSHREDAVAETGREVTLAVTDTGCGIDPEVRSRIFDPFFTTKPAHEGTGLGLAVVDGIVEQHRGRLEIESVVGSGTTMRVVLPTTDAIVEEPVSAASSIPDKGREVILVLDDSPLVLSLLASTLRGLGYDTLTADSPQTAIDLAAKHDGDIDLLLTDVVMPGMSGRQVASALQTKRPALKVVYISGYSANHLAGLDVSDENVAFISKPFRRTTLSETLRRVLDE